MEPTSISKFLPKKIITIPLLWAWNKFPIRGAFYNKNKLIDFLFYYSEDENVKAPSFHRKSIKGFSNYLWDKGYVCMITVKYGDKETKLRTPFFENINDLTKYLYKKFPEHAEIINEHYTDDSSERPPLKINNTYSEYSEYSDDCDHW